VLVESRKLASSQQGTYTMGGSEGPPIFWGILTFGDLAIQTFKEGSHAILCRLSLSVRRAPATMPSTGSRFRDYAGTEHD
jgi:hypothetical protein